MNALHFFFGFGAFLSPIIIAQVVLLSGGIRVAYWTLGLLVVPVVIWLLRLRSPTHHEAASYSGGHKEINYVLAGLVALFMLLYVGAEVSFGGWIFTYAVTLGLATATTAAYLTSIFWGALTVGRLLAIPIAMVFRPRTILLVDLLGCIASVGLILLLPSSAAAVWIGAAGLGLFMASIFPTTIIWAGRRMTLSGAITSWFLIGSSLGAMTFPLIIGQLFESQGPQVVMVVIFGVLLAATALFVGLMFYAGQPTAEEA
jgi:FHS family Na+ dependent glucose MFS transporter 1